MSHSVNGDNCGELIPRSDDNSAGLPTYEAETS